MIRYRCPDCSAPLDRNPPRKSGQPAAGYCDCSAAVWLLPAEGAPVKLVVTHDNGAAFEALHDRVLVVATETVPPRSPG
jgi:hypothetical protein